MTNSTTTTTKTCPKCGATKPVSEFNKNKSRPDGLSHWCSSCMREAHAKYRKSPKGQATTRRVSKEYRDAQKVAVYQINFTDGSYYIGKTTALKNRMSFHRSTLKTNTHVNSQLQAKYNELGSDAMSFKIVAECREDSLDQMEAYFLNKNIDDDNCLNIYKSLADKKNNE